jgi:hypothetical protein
MDSLVRSFQKRSQSGSTTYTLSTGRIFSALVPAHGGSVPRTVTAPRANECEDKVTQGELRATSQEESVTGHVSNRACIENHITLSGALNEAASVFLPMVAVEN